ncbi:MAG: TRAM domain-containing protein [bacterium]|nr:TRAM domain-containing protein [bacterium]
MVFQYILRLFLGALFGVLGYLVSYQYVPHIKVFFVPDFYQFLITLSCTVYGYFALPFAFITYQRMLVGWLFNFVRSIIGDTLQDFYSRLGEEFNSELGVGRKRKEIKDRKIEPILNPMILDTSAIIDGRIGEIIKTGFLAGTFIIPQFVIQELQFIADSPDVLKRGRGRKGLELLNQMKKLKIQKDKIGIKIVTNDYEKIKKVDDKLIRLAKTMKGSIVTTDFNLNKVAAFQSIRILNVNDLSNAVKTVTLPGEEMDIKVIQEGKEKNQGVGYLDDGTMVVVENAQGLVGQTIKVSVSRVLQTAAGKMIFTDTKKAM